MKTDGEQGARFYRVRNHEKFQHYKRRNPPWIKFHSSAMTDYAFSSLPDATKWHAMGIAVLASQTDNHIPNDSAWVGRLICATEKVELMPLIGIGFLVECDCETCAGQDASKTLAACKQNASNMLATCKQSAMPEKRREEREERERESRAEILAHFEEWWLAYPKKVEKKECSEKWMSLHRDGDLPAPEALIEKLQHQTHEDRQWREGYIPNPLTYLNGARWEDEIDTRPTEDERETQRQHVKAMRDLGVM